MRVKWLLFAVLFLFLPSFALAVGGEDETEERTDEKPQDLSVEQGVSAWMMQLDPAAWAEIYALLPEEARSFWQGQDALSMIESYAFAENLPNAESVLESLGSSLLDSVRRELPLLFTLVGIALLSAFSRIFSTVEYSWAAATIITP